MPPSFRRLAWLAHPWDLQQRIDLREGPTGRAGPVGPVELALEAGSSVFSKSPFVVIESTYSGDNRGCPGLMLDHLQPFPDETYLHIDS